MLVITQHELPSRQPLGIYNFNVAPTFLVNVCRELDSLISDL